MGYQAAGWMFHYTDDFITIGETNPKECAVNMARMERISNELGLPTEDKKTQGPVTYLTLLGTELDTVAMEICLPHSKLSQLKQVLVEWKGKKVARKRTLIPDW